ncbi:hypothetical protein JQ615_35675 [Bradyrhizobium jicamae]|uniref:Secreted protein n=1 Tax=Bradyrhizobium jicamae TaxID=280332 RepID=A0ABS5FVA7_9BRAD|nr:hypothetical protein [Bradyrhizobium jicamae]MBR0800715.1 hypothetical protein [Bradyrhizobium jicamae]MBR0936617.1 hypothetical protein [Bradyrhizobium jicamae]
MRFVTAKALYETFPEVLQAIGVEPTDQPPIEFVKALVLTGKLPEAATFCAYLLPRREAVWWACTSVRTLGADTRAETSMAAEAWVYQPDDHHRQRALDTGTMGDQNEPQTWLALAAGWSGGVRMVGGQQVPNPPFMTARAARVAILLSAGRLGVAERTSGLRSCVAAAIKLVESGLG